jgi:hypothetical protein
VRVSARAPNHPASYAEFRVWFPDDESCMDYLDRLRWPDGRACPVCGRVTSPAAPGRVWRCGRCGKRVSRTAGTIFQDTRTPLTVWFAAAWYMMADPGGVAALTMQRLLGLGSYQTAWAMLHRYRAAMACPARDLLTGRIEVMAAPLRAERPRPATRDASDRTTGGRSVGGPEMTVAVAVELREPRGYGRARIGVIPGTEAQHLRAFLATALVPWSTVVSDTRGAFPAACDGRFRHEPHAVAGSLQPPPAVRQVASLCRQWLAGTHHGSARPEQIQSYVDEFCFRFNRRHAKARGALFYRLMQQAAGAAPVTYRQIVDASATRLPRLSKGDRTA